MADVQGTEEAPKQGGVADPYEFLASISGPTKDQVEAFKQNVPNGRIRIFTPDGKRGYLLRAISGLELAQIQKSIPPNSSNIEYDASIGSAVLCTIWTNASADGKLSEVGLRGGSAGLPSTLWNLITLMSDFVDPQDFAACSAEL
jgi:hypothetical protein